MKSRLAPLALVLLLGCGGDDPGGTDPDVSADANGTDAVIDTSGDAAAADADGSADDVSPDDSSGSTDTLDAVDTDDADDADIEVVDVSSYHPDQPGVWHSAVTRVELHDASRERTIPVEIWYPTATPEGSGESVTVYAAEGSDRDALAALVETAPEACTARRTAATRDAALAELPAPAPLVVLSHCHGCTRYAYARIAEHLATRGFVVAAPEHAGNTLYDSLRDALMPLEAATLEMRAADVSAVIDLLLGDEAPEALRGHIDAERIAAAGHSFGSVTTGRVLVLDDRARVGVALAAPFESPLLPGVAMTDIAEPVLFVVAREDNSITEFGNNFIRDNFDASQPGSYKLELVDAGHWSFTEICALTNSFDACCGDARRQTNGRSFTYPPVDSFVLRVEEFATAFLEAELGADAIAAAWLAQQTGEHETFGLQSRP